MMSTYRMRSSIVRGQHHLVGLSVGSWRQGWTMCKMMLLLRAPKQKATRDDGIAEFCRFYIDRREEELAAAGTDPRTRKKIADDFTPRLEAHLVGLEGSVRRQFRVNAIFELGTGHEYASSITVIPTE